MSLYTNEGLVKHAEKALALNTKYMWGGILRPITSSYIRLLRTSYGTNSGTGYTESRYKELEKVAGKNYYGVDCIGLIKSYYWSGKADGGTGSPNYGSDKKYPDVNAGAMYNAAKRKGTITTMPEVAGLIVYSKSHPHVGIYIGNGYTIESTLGSRGDGVVKRKLDNLWEYWFRCPYIEYMTDKAANTYTAALIYNAVLRDKPSSQGRQISKLCAGSKVTVVRASETRDSVSGFVYVRTAGEKQGWIVKSALGRGE